MTYRRPIRILLMVAALYVGLQAITQIMLGSQSPPHYIVMLAHANDGKDMITRIWQHQWEYYSAMYPGSYICKERELQDPPKCTRKEG